ncbi:asparaginase [Parapusillimonas sp. SGNA-6]|nr:asparaginase [Parapusillimonas sp. SGNA-6]
MSGLRGCVLISTGGTIASRRDASGVARPEVSAAGLLAAVPDATNVARLYAEEVFCLPSPHIGPPEWRLLHRALVSALDRDDVAGAVVSHGTAVMEETAWFLDLTINHEKPIILTGAQRNASEAESDGPRNLLDAIRIAVSPSARNKGVLVALNQHINAARDVIKTHSFNVETFYSGERGFLGQVSPEKVTFYREPIQRLHIPLRECGLPVVEIISMYAGASGALMRAAASHARGIVVQAVGGGHVNPDLFTAISNAIASGITVVVATRSPHGGTRAGYGFTGSSRDLQQAGAILSGDLNAWKARILLSLALQNNLAHSDIEELFQT